MPNGPYFSIDLVFMRIRYAISRLMSGAVRFLLVVGSLLVICQLTLMLSESKIGAVRSDDGVESVADGGNAFELAWSVINGRAQRPAADGAKAASTSVRAMVGDGTLKTLWVSGLALLVILGLGIPLGILRGRSRKNPFAWLLALPFAIGVCMPVFWLAAVSEWWLLDRRSLLLPDSEIGGEIGGFAVSFSGGSAWFLENWPGFVLALIIGLAGTAWLMRSVSGSIQHAAQADHLWVGRMRGMRNSQLFHRHTLRNSLRPIVMSIAESLPFVLGAAILAEGVLGFQGLGGLLYHAGLEHDFGILLAGSFVFALLVLVARVFGEMLLGLVDPRVRQEGGGDA